MQFSTFTRYGLRALIRLAEISNQTNKPVSVREIAEREQISIKYLENIFAILKKNGYIASQKGKFGGYKLTKSPDQITVLEIVKSLEGEIAPVKCVIDKKYCSFKEQDTCNVHPIWNELNNVMVQTLENRTIKGLISENQSSE